MARAARGRPGRGDGDYRAAGDLHIADTRVEAVEQAARAYDRLAGELGHERVALMSDASNVEIDTLNLRIQALRRERGELAPEVVERPDGQRFHGDDRVTWTASMPVSDEPRVENGVRGTVVGVDAERGALTVRLDGADRDVAVAGEGVESLRLAYAGHVYRQQGATVDRAVVVTGGWQTSRESAYVQASRARHGVEWHVAREDLDSPDDAARIDALARRMGQTRAQEPSLALPLDAPGRAPGDPIAELHVARLQPPAPTPLEPAPAVEIAP